MKTYNGKNITKKEIEEVLRTMDSTQIFRLYHIIYGGKADKSGVYQFINDFAPTKRIANAAYRLAYVGKEEDAALLDMEERNRFVFAHENARHLTMQHFRYELLRGLDSYTKRPIMGHSYLYWASPEYGHADYNKSRALPITGNERFCALICQMADKYLSKN